MSTLFIVYAQYKYTKGVNVILIENRETQSRIYTGYFFKSDYVQGERIMTAHNISVKRKCNVWNSSVQRKYWWGGVPEWLSIAYIFLNRLMFYSCYNMPKIENGTDSYLTLTWRKFLQGQRMPLYPMLIYLNRFLFHDKYLMGVVFCQIIVSLISVLYFYRAVRLATENRAIACITVCFYGTNPWIMHFDGQILSESFAISISIFLLYHTICYIRSHSLRSGIWMVFCVFLAVLEKSALFVYVVSFLIFMIIQFFSFPNKRRMILKLSAVLLGMACLLLLYAGQVWRNAATFSIDNRGPLHTLVACLETDLYQKYPDQELVKKIEKIWLENDKSIQMSTTLEPIEKLFGKSLKERNTRIDEFNNYCIRSDPDVYIKYLMQRFIRVAGKKYILGQTDVNKESATFSIIHKLMSFFSLDMNIGRIYLIGGTVFLLLIIKWKISKECPWYYLGTAGLIMVIIVSVIIGTYSSYARCTSYVLPFAFFGMALICNDLHKWIERFRE